MTKPVHSHCNKAKTNNTLHLDLYNRRTNKFFNQLTFCQTLLAICSLTISQVHSAFKSDRPFVTIKAQGVTSSWLYDTGAAITLISITEFRKILPENRPPKKPVMVNLTCASDQQLKTVGLYDMKLTIGNRTIIHPVYVTENKTQAILGIDAIKAFGLNYSPSKHSFSFENSVSANSQPVHAISPIAPMPTSDLDLSSSLTSISTLKSVTLPPLTSLSLSVSTISSLGLRPAPGVLGLAHVGTSAFPYLNGGPGLVTTDRLGEMTVRINNCSPAELILPKNSIIGFFEPINSANVQELENDIFINAVNKVSSHFPPQLSVPDQKEFLKKLKLSVPPSELPLYLDLLLKNHDVFSSNKNDLGCATNATHTIHLKHTAPIYVKQFPVPESYRSQLNLQVKEWLKMGVIKPTNSHYNSPIFVVPKKDGSPRYVLDF